MTDETTPDIDPEEAAEAKRLLDQLADGAVELKQPKDRKPQRDAWLAYGRILCRARAAFNGSRNKLGKWVHDNGLDTGPATDAAVRSAAMWFAEQVDSDQATAWIDRISATLHNPKYVRAAYNNLDKPKREKKAATTSDEMTAEEYIQAGIDVHEFTFEELRNALDVISQPQMEAA